MTCEEAYVPPQYRIGSSELHRLTTVGDVCLRVLAPELPRGPLFMPSVDLHALPRNLAIETPTGEVFSGITPKSERQVLREKTRNEIAQLMQQEVDQLRGSASEPEAEERAPPVVVTAYPRPRTGDHRTRHDKNRRIVWQ